jgi:hypothetical protein
MPVKARSVSIFIMPVRTLLTGGEWKINMKFLCPKIQEMSEAALGNRADRTGMTSHSE